LGSTILSWQKTAFQTGVLTVLALPLIVVFVLWAILMFGVGFQDSEGRPNVGSAAGAGDSVSLLPQEHGLVSRQGNQVTYTPLLQPDHFTFQVGNPG
jgi:hypothetical protein